MKYTILIYNKQTFKTMIASIYKVENYPKGSLLTFRNNKPTKITILQFRNNEQNIIKLIKSIYEETL